MKQDDAERKIIHSTIKLSKIKIVLSSTPEVIPSFDFIICFSAELNSSLSPVTYWFWILGLILIYEGQPIWFFRFLSILSFKLAS